MENDDDAHKDKNREDSLVDKLQDPKPKPHYEQTIPISVSTIGISPSTSTTSLCSCRICQLPLTDPSNPLISPCRCSGSIKYVHASCLQKWLEMQSSSKSSSPACEICHYRFKRHKQIKMTRCRVPSCSRKDKIAHLVFFFSILITIGCFSLVVCLSNQPLPSKPSELSPNLTALEMLSLLGGVFLFLSFFVAIYAEGSADLSLLQYFCQCVRLNLHWTVEEYDEALDTQGNT